LQFNDIIDTIFTSNVTVAFIVAIVLDNTYNVKASKKDRGMPWWANFRSFSKDSRTEEFYSLPFQLHKFFPPA
jgi:nucleobase transporter 1/2